MTSTPNALGKTSNALIDARDIKRSINLVVKNWYWFVLFIAMGVSAGLVFLYNATKFYGANSTILLKSKESMLDMSTEAKNSAFENKPDISNEILILSSRKLTNDAIEKLEVDVSY